MASKPVSDVIFEPTQEQLGAAKRLMAYYKSSVPIDLQAEVAEDIAYLLASREKEPGPVPDDEVIGRLAWAVNRAIDHLPLRLVRGTHNVVMLDRHDVCVLDMMSSNEDAFCPFDLYIREAVNAVPALIAEIRRLRRELAKR